MNIKFEPCYPPGTNLDEQLNHVEQEYQEIMEAREGGTWEELASEYLDLSQTVVGLMEIVRLESEGYGVEPHLRSTTFDIRYSGITDMNLEQVYSGFKNIVNSSPWTGQILYHCQAVCKKSLNLFYQLIWKHDRGNDNYRRELLNRFLQEHQEKLVARRKEWLA